MPGFQDVYAFQSLYDAHRAARRGKQGRREVAEFELDLGRNLAGLSAQLEDGTYRMQPYVRFIVDDPKRRVIHALRYRDRVVQHSLCDNVLGPVLEPRLIYDNAACRMGKGSRFALDRLELFLREHHRAYGAQGWFLKCDVRRYFASIRHDVLLEKLRRPPFDERTCRFLSYIVDSYSDSADRGLPLGNQTSQWFALYYLDGIDRLVKERLHVRGYVRYMDDMVLVHPDRRHLRECLRSMEHAAAEIGLEFNGKTQVAPLSQGMDFLGWHLYLTPAGRVVRRLRASAKRRMRRRLRTAAGAPGEYCAQVAQGYLAHLAAGDARGLERIAGKYAAAAHWEHLPAPV